MAEIKYKFEAVMIVSGVFMLLTMYELPVASYFKFTRPVPSRTRAHEIHTVLKQSIIYYRCFQQIAVQLLMPLIFQTLIPTYIDDNRDDDSALFWILDVIEYLMYFTTIYLLKRVITLLDLF